MTDVTKNDGTLKVGKKSFWTIVATVVMGILYQPGMDMVDRVNGALSGPTRSDAVSALRGDTFNAETGEPQLGPNHLQVWNQTLVNSKGIQEVQAALVVLNASVADLVSVLTPAVDPMEGEIQGGEDR